MFSMACGRSFCKRLKTLQYSYHEMQKARLRSARPFLLSISILADLGIILGHAKAGNRGWAQGTGVLVKRGPRWANAFMQDVASRIDSRIQITTDGHPAYAEAVEGAFGMDVDYAMLIKLYGNDLSIRSTASASASVRRQQCYRATLT